MDVVGLPATGVAFAGVAFGLIGLDLRQVVVVTAGVAGLRSAVPFRSELVLIAVSVLLDRPSAR